MDAVVDPFCSMLLLVQVLLFILRKSSIDEPVNLRCDNALAPAAGLPLPRNGVTLNVLANRIPGAVKFPSDPTNTPVFLLVKHTDLFVLTHLYSHLSVRLLVTF